MRQLNWTPEAEAEFNRLQAAAKKAAAARAKMGKTKSSKQEGLFKQVTKALDYLRTNPRHSSLQTHEFHSLSHPWSESEKVFEAYAQNDTPGAYRIFWCYGPGKGEITVIAITSHP